jgi:hypothetical protein
MYVSGTHVCGLRPDLPMDSYIYVTVMPDHVSDKLHRTSWKQRSKIMDFDGRIMTNNRYIIYPMTMRVLLITTYKYNHPNSVSHSHSHYHSKPISNIHIQYPICQLSMLTPGIQFQIPSTLTAEDTK